VAIRPLISKILGPPAVLFLAFVTCYVAYQIVGGAIDAKKMKSGASAAIERFHARFNRNDFSSACEDVFLGQELPLDCVSQLKDVKSRFGSFQRLLKIKFQVISEPHYVRAETVSIYDKGELTERFLARPMSNSELGIQAYQALSVQEGHQ